MMMRDLCYNENVFCHGKMELLTDATDLHR